MAELNVDHTTIAVVYQAQSYDLLKILSEKQFPVTLLDAVGGFLHDQAVTLVVGVPHRRLPYFFYRAKQDTPALNASAAGGSSGALGCYPACDMVEVRAGGASIFVLPVDHYLATQA